MTGTEDLDPGISAALNSLNGQLGDSSDLARFLSTYDFSQPDASTSAIPMDGLPAASTAEQLQLTPRGSNFPLIPASSAPSFASLQSYLDRLPSSSVPASLPSLLAPAPADSGGGAERALNENNTRLDAMTRRMDALQGGIDQLMGSLQPDAPYDESFWNQFSACPIALFLSRLLH